MYFSFLWFSIFLCCCCCCWYVHEQYLSYWIFAANGFNSKWKMPMHHRNRWSHWMKLAYEMLLGLISAQFILVFRCSTINKQTDCFLESMLCFEFYCRLLAVKCGKFPLIIHSRSIYIKTCLISCCFLYIRVLVGYIIQHSHRY